MATTSNTGAAKPATKPKTPRKSTTGSAARQRPDPAPRDTGPAPPRPPATPPRPAVEQATTRRSTAATTRRSTAGTTARPRHHDHSTQPKTPVEQAQEIAERAVLVPVGRRACWCATTSSRRSRGSRRSTRTRAGLERELKRYERRGATARNRFERQVRRTRDAVRARAAPAPQPRRAHGPREPPPVRARGAAGPQGPREAVRDVSARRQARVNAQGLLASAS